MLADHADRVFANLAEGAGPEWTGPRFVAFLKRMGWTDTEAARQVGKTRKTIASYRQKGAPRVVRYACLMRELETLAQA